MDPIKFGWSYFVLSQRHAQDFLQVMNHWSIGKIEKRKGTSASCWSDKYSNKCQSPKWQPRAAERSFDRPTCEGALWSEFYCWWLFLWLHQNNQGRWFHSTLEQTWQVDFRSSQVDLARQDTCGPNIRFNPGGAAIPRGGVAWVLRAGKGQLVTKLTSWLVTSSWAQDKQNQEELLETKPDECSHSGLDWKDYLGKSGPKAGETIPARRGHMLNCRDHEWWSCGFWVQVSISEVSDCCHLEYWEGSGPKRSLPKELHLYIVRERRIARVLTHSAMKFFSCAAKKWMINNDHILSQGDDCGRMGNQD